MGSVFDDDQSPANEVAQGTTTANILNTSANNLRAKLKKKKADHFEDHGILSEDIAWIITILTEECARPLQSAG